MAIYDEYYEAKKLSVLLNDEGFETLARTLIDDIAGGNTSTEILSNLGLHIKQFLASPGSATVPIVELAKDLYRHIEAKLK